MGKRSLSLWSGCVGETGGFRRFGSDKIYREDILAPAYDLAKANQGAPGVDGQTFAGIECWGREKWLAKLRDELRTKGYQP